MATSNQAKGTEHESTVSDTASALKERLRAEITDALRAGDKVRLGALRLLSAGITNREKELRHPLSDEEVREVARREAKKRSEAIEAYAAAGRDELATKERFERDALAPYLPEQLSDEQVNALIDEAIASTGATSIKEMGAVMGAVMARAGGAADGSVVQGKVRARLNG
jgi:uncharacterized protein